MTNSVLQTLWLNCIAFCFCCISHAANGAVIEESLTSQGQRIQVRLFADSVKGDFYVEATQNETSLRKNHMVSVKLEIQRAGKQVFVPNHVLASLPNPIAISIKNLNSKNSQISVRGGDALNAYVARIIVGANRVLKLELFEMGSQQPIYSTTYYQHVIE